MAKKATKPRGANKYTPPEKSNAPAWIWLIAGVVIGSFIMFLMKLEPKKEIRPTQKTTEVAQAKDNKTKFVFQDILAGKEPNTTPLTEQQLKQLDGERAAALLNAQQPPAIPVVQPAAPKPIAPKPVVTEPPATTAPAIAVTPPPKPTAAPEVKRPTQVATIAPPAKTSFFLQVGAYPTKQGAESIRAQVLMLGQNARLENFTTGGKTWYRVLVGSFNSKETATQAQKKLASSGFKQAIIVPRKVQ